jgi:predicted metal-dependent peptidase
MEEIYRIYLAEYQEAQRKASNGGQGSTGKSGSSSSSKTDKGGKKQKGQSSGAGDSATEKEQQESQNSGEYPGYGPCGSRFDPYLKDPSSVVDIIPSTDEENKLKEAEQKWKEIFHNAVKMARDKGSVPAYLERFIQEIMAPQISWREMLAKFLTISRNDFDGFDRRFIHEGTYVDDVFSQEAVVYVCIDTSGSITDDVLKDFYSELVGILSVASHVQIQLYFADAALYGPHEITSEAPTLPKAEGGGGTSFVPFFKELLRLKNTDASLSEKLKVAVYLTDGYGDFPSTSLVEELAVPTLWVVQVGGLETERFPFGEVCRLSR